MSGALRNVARQLDAITAVLGPALATWATRDGAQAQPGVRQAANTALAAIDDSLALLHKVRSELVSQIRASDDATMARADAMLAEGRAVRETEGARPEWLYGSGCCEHWTPEDGCSQHTGRPAMSLKARGLDCPGGGR